MCRGLIGGSEGMYRCKLTFVVERKATALRPVRKKYPNGQRISSTIDDWGICPSRAKRSAFPKIADIDHRYSRGRLVVD
jgi:hypothetical protein